jgi:hypothetical protein
MSDMACSNSSIASSALRPSQGEAAACAVLPKNSREASKSRNAQNNAQQHSDMETSAE